VGICGHEKELSVLPIEAGHVFGGASSANLVAVSGHWRAPTNNDAVTGCSNPVSD